MTASKNDGRASFLRLFPQLFLFPLLIVVVGVLVYLLFVASGKDSRGVEELITDIESGGEHARKQDAYVLALQVRDLAPGESLSGELTQRLLRLRERFGDDREFSDYLTRALGRAGQPDLTLPLMRRLAIDPETEMSERISAVTALGLMRSDEAAQVLMDVVEAYSQADDWEVRWRALGGLANLRHDPARALLTKALGDARREVRWSAACWLATVYEDPAGIDILESLVDWEFLDAQLGDGRPLHQDEKVGYITQAIGGLALIRRETARPTLEALSRDDRSLKVRDAAIRALDWLDESTESKGAERSTAPPSTKTAPLPTEPSSSAAGKSSAAWGPVNHRATTGTGERASQPVESVDLAAFFTNRRPIRSLNLSL